jgi:hypothetical protein
MQVGTGVCGDEWEGICTKDYFCPPKASRSCALPDGRTGTWLASRLYRLPNAIGLDTAAVSRGSALWSRAPSAERPSWEATWRCTSGSMRGTRVDSIQAPPHLHARFYSRTDKHSMS